MLDLLPNRRALLALALAAPLAAFAQTWPASPIRIVARLNAEIVAVLGERHVREQLVAQGFDIVASSPDALAREVERGAPRWAALVRDAHATVD